MINTQAGLATTLDDDLIGFLTAVNAKGQPQTSPVWFIRDGDDIVVFNRTDAARLRSVAGNSKVAFNLRADRAGHAGVSLEATAAVDDGALMAKDFSGYVDKYGREIEGLGWTPETFSSDYPVALRLTVTRVRAWGIDQGI